MNHFYFSGPQASPNPSQPKVKPVNRSKYKPTMRVVRRADGSEATINVSKFHEALHEEAIAPEEARMLVVTTPHGTQSVEMTFAYLERLPDDAIRSLDIAMYVKGGNCMDRRELTKAILDILGHTEDIVKAMTIEDKEKILMQEWESRLEAEKAARVATIEEAKRVAVEAAKQSMSKKKAEAPKAAPKAAPKKPSTTED